MISRIPVGKILRALNFNLLKIRNGTTPLQVGEVIITGHDTDLVALLFSETQISEVFLYKGLIEKNTKMI